MEKENLQHFFNSCNTVNEISKTYFDKFMTGQVIEFDISFLMRGAPTSLTKSKIMILNIEIIIFCFLLYKYKYRKKLPRLINIEFYFSHCRFNMLKNSKYRRAWLGWGGEGGVGDDD